MFVPTVQSVRCPPHGIVARYASLALLPLLLWGVAHAVFGPIGAAPNGTLFLLIAMVVCALLLGRLFELARDAIECCREISRH